MLITIRQQTQFINVLATRLLSHRDFEMVQTLLSVFLKLHGESLIENEDMQTELQGLLKISRSENERIRALVNKGMGLLSFVREVG